MTIGREVGDIVLGDDMCSSRHAEVRWDGAQLQVKDLGSTNGTFVNKQRVSAVALHPGQSFAIGRCTLHLDADGAGEAKTAVAMPAFVAGAQQASPAPQAPVVRAAPAAIAKPAPTDAWDAPETAARKSGKGPLLLAGLGGGFLVLVALVVFGLMSTRGAGGKRTSGEATVNAVAFYTNADGAAAGSAPAITVRIKKNTSNGVSVGVIEEFSGGTGDMWRTATWMAAFNASRLAGISLADHEYLVRAGGHIDGPSAGLLMTATMLALLNGERIDDSATMTGTINPDGTAGPVGGIPHKMQGAKEAGKKRFGYPIGQRNGRDVNRDTIVDLHQLGASLGFEEVRELKDVYDAYNFLTGATLERTQPVDEAAMELTSEDKARLSAKIGAWKGEVLREAEKMKTRVRKNRAFGKAMMVPLASVESVLEQAATAEAGDQPSAAWAGYVQARTLLGMMGEMIDFAEAVSKRDFETVASHVNAARAGAATVRAFGQELALNSKKTSVGGQVNLMRAMVAQSQAEALATFGDHGYKNGAAVMKAIADGKLPRSRKALTAMVSQLLQPVMFYAASDVLLRFARDQKDLANEEGEEAQSDFSVLAREAAGYGSAAGAALAYFEATHVKPSADAAQMSMDDAQSKFAEKEFTYPLARFEVMVAESRRGNVSDPGAAMQLIASGLDAFLNAASLVNKYYALGAHTDEGGELKLRHRKALSAQLDQARLAAREAAARAQERAGFIPIAARIAYQDGRAAREGRDEDKVNAIRSFWESAAWSDMAGRLAQ